jgi:phosphotriesterase-related protein
MMSHDSIVCWRGRPVPFANSYDDVLAMLPQWRPTFIFEHVVPQLREAGLTSEDIDTILVDNPRRLFAN